MREKIQLYQELICTAGVSGLVSYLENVQNHSVKTEVFLWACQTVLVLLMFFIDLTSIYNMQTDKSVTFLSAELEPVQMITSASTLPGQNVCRKQKAI